MIPTLLCSTSILPKTSIAALTAAATESAFETSQTVVSTAPPSPRMICAVSATAAGFKSSAKTFAPSRANCTAAALPFPHPGPIDPAPVTKTTLSFNRAPTTSSLRFGWGGLWRWRGWRGIGLRFGG